MSIVLVPGDVPRIRIHPRIEGLTVRIQTLLRHLERRFVRALLHVERGFYEVDEALVRRRQRFVFEIPEQVGAARDQVAGVGLDDVAALLDEKRRQLVLCGARRAGFDAPGERTSARAAIFPGARGAAFASCGPFRVLRPAWGRQSRPRMLVRWLAPVSPGLLCASAGRAS